MTRCAKPVSKRVPTLVLVMMPLFVFGLLSYGCSSKKSKSPKAGLAAEQRAAKEKAEQESELLKNPLEARFADDENIAIAKKMGEIAKDVNPADAPDYAKKMVEHLKNVTRIFKENADNCDKAVAALKKYVQDNKADIKALRKTGDQAQAKMSNEQKSILSTQTILLMGPIAKDLVMAQAQFVTNCREQAEEIADLMQTVVGD